MKELDIVGQLYQGDAQKPVFVGLRADVVRTAGDQAEPGCNPAALIRAECGNGGLDEISGTCGIAGKGGRMFVAITCCCTPHPAVSSSDCRRKIDLGGAASPRDLGGNSELLSRRRLAVDRSVRPRLSRSFVDNGTHRRAHPRSCPQLLALPESARHPKTLCLVDEPAMQIGTRHT